MALKVGASGPISRLYGNETFNYYSGNPINRLSFVRDDYSFLNDALKHKTTRFLCLKKLNPLMREIDEAAPRSNPDGMPITHELIYASYDDVKHLVGDPFAKPEAEAIKGWSSKRDALGVGNPGLAFLGVDETVVQSAAADGSSVPDHVSYKDLFKGHAYFALNVDPADAESPELKAKLQDFLDTSPVVKQDGVKFTNLRLFVRLDYRSFAIYGQARMYIDWANRTRFCAGCGSRLMNINGGCKLTCPSHDAGVEKSACNTRGVVTYHSFPRTDSSIIVAVVNYANDRILLGRGRRFPPGFYSCLAGFLEPAEAIEDCVRREVWEEAGVKVGRVVVHSTQPWPYPANIMVGCVAEVADDTPASHRIDLGHDPELADAQWFTFDDARKALARTRDPGYSILNASDEDKFNIPGIEAIANILIEAVVSKSSPLSKI